MTIMNLLPKNPIVCSVLNRITAVRWYDRFYFRKSAIARATFRIHSHSVAERAIFVMAIFISSSHDESIGENTLTAPPKKVTNPEGLRLVEVG